MVHGAVDAVDDNNAEEGVEFLDRGSGRRMRGCGLFFAVAAVADCFFGAVLFLGEVHHAAAGCAGAEIVFKVVFSAPLLRRWEGRRESSSLRASGPRKEPVQAY